MSWWTTLMIIPITKWPTITRTYISTQFSPTLSTTLHNLHILYLCKRIKNGPFIVTLVVLSSSAHGNVNPFPEILFNTTQQHRKGRNSSFIYLFIYTAPLSLTWLYSFTAHTHLPMCLPFIPPRNTASLRMLSATAAVDNFPYSAAFPGKIFERLTLTRLVGEAETGHESKARRQGGRATNSLWSSRPAWVRKPIKSSSRLWRS